MGYAVRHIVNTDVDTFWRVYFDLEFARAVVKEFGNMGDFKIIDDHVDEQGVRHRRIEVWSNVELPAFAQKLIGNGAYTEIGQWDSKLKKYTAECVPQLNADKFSSRFEISAHPLPESRCEREIHMENTIKMFGIGGMVTSVLECVQRDTHAKSALFLNAWLEKLQRL
ncbi:MAG: hypothetical protein RL701_6155 [Pseudomonadota bacterium]